MMMTQPKASRGIKCFSIKNQLDRKPKILNKREGGKKKTFMKEERKTIEKSW